MVSLGFRREFAAAVAKLSKMMKNRFALGWAPGRPQARFIKAVSGGLGFSWVSQGIRCKAHKKMKKHDLGLFYRSPSLRSGYFLSIKLIGLLEYST